MRSASAAAPSVPPLGAQSGGAWCAPRTYVLAAAVEERLRARRAPLRALRPLLQRDQTLVDRREHADLLLDDADARLADGLRGLGRVEPQPRVDELGLGARDALGDDGRLAVLDLLDDAVAHVGDLVAPALDVLAHAALERALERPHRLHVAREALAGPLALADAALDLAGDRHLVVPQTF